MPGDFVHRGVQTLRYDMNSLAPRPVQGCPAESGRR